ncbi:extracellular matrix protein [Arthroderma uncinatum]|uniref:extracellular matrix protein n=1 Tax=Arthroderma uncinatum TaxID=74035 RepID=UPI00144AC9B1|nr:extracellular matrix protein [Arthroderma uncinatum]KAF3481994.1 extracellular matrix protein [Arthroderma uncinatum]
MQLFKTLLAGAALVASVVAQGQIAFTSFPSNLVAGKPFEVKWTGGAPGAPVTITLRKGPSDDLKDVAVLTSSATGGSYTFTPSTSLVSGPDYALQITQGSQINYTGLFSITGGTGKPSSTSATTTASSGYPTKPVTKPVSTTHASMTITNSANSTTMMTMTSSGTASMGTGTTTHRNTTMATPTLSSTRTPTLSPTAKPTGNAASSLAAMSSPLALIMAALAAFAYLN